MSVIYGFYNSQNGDRKYNARDLNNIFDGVIENGIFKNWGSAFSVEPTKPTSLGCVVNTGKAWLNNTWTINDSPHTINNIPPVLGSGKSRIDAVVIKVDTTNRVNSIEYVTGTMDYSPKKPTLSDNQYPIAYITISAAIGHVVPSGIQYVGGISRENGGTPWVTGILQQADVSALVAQWDAAIEAWFEEIKGQMSIDTAVNLKNEIDNKITSGSTPIDSSMTLDSSSVYFQYED